MGKQLDLFPRLHKFVVWPRGKYVPPFPARLRPWALRVRDTGQWDSEGLRPLMRDWDASEFNWVLAFAYKQKRLPEMYEIMDAVQRHDASVSPSTRPDHRSFGTVLNVASQRSTLDPPRFRRVIDRFCEAALAGAVSDEGEVTGAFHGVHYQIETGCGELPLRGMERLLDVVRAQPRGLPLTVDAMWYATDLYARLAHVRRCTGVLFLMRQCGMRPASPHFRSLLCGVARAGQFHKLDATLRLLANTFEFDAAEEPGTRDLVAALAAVARARPELLRPDDLRARADSEIARVAVSSLDLNLSLRGLLMAERARDMPHFVARNATLADHTSQLLLLQAMYSDRRHLPQPGELLRRFREGATPLSAASLRVAFRLPAPLSELLAIKQWVDAVRPPSIYSVHAFEALIVRAARENARAAWELFADMRRRCGLQPNTAILVAMRSLLPGEPPAKLLSLRWELVQALERRGLDPPL